MFSLIAAMVTLASPPKTATFSFEFTTSNRTDVLYEFSTTSRDRIELKLKSNGAVDVIVISKAAYQEWISVGDHMGPFHPEAKEGGTSFTISQTLPTADIYYVVVRVWKLTSSASGTVSFYLKSAEDAKQDLTVIFMAMGFIGLIVGLSWAIWKGHKVDVKIVDSKGHILKY